MTSFLLGGGVNDLWVSGLSSGFCRIQALLRGAVPEHVGVSSLLERCGAWSWGSGLDQASLCLAGAERAGSLRLLLPDLLVRWLQATQLEAA